MLNRKDKSMALCWPCGCPLAMIFCDHSKEFTFEFEREDFYDRYLNFDHDDCDFYDRDDDHWMRDLDGKMRPVQVVFDSFDDDDPFEDDRPTKMSMRHSVKGDKCLVLDGRDRARGGWGRRLERQKEMR